jgi:hypothetical protein
MTSRFLIVASIVTSLALPQVAAAADIPIRYCCAVVMPGVNANAPSPYPGKDRDS